MEASLTAIVDRVTRRMRAAERVGRTVVLRLRFDDFSRATRSHTLPRATSHTETILATAQTLLSDAGPMIEERGITLVGISVGNLDSGNHLQLALPFDAHATNALDAALDDLRERFGSSSITRAALLGKDTGMTVPMLPD